MEPLSVLISARNEQRTILRAVKSVLRQLRKNDECVVYDDASADDTGRLLAGVSDERLRVITGKKQIGTSAAANILNHEAQNSLIAKMDADDISLQGRFEYQRKKITEEGIDFLFGCVLLQRGPLIIPQPARSMDAKEIYEVLPQANPLVNSTVMTRREIVDVLGGYPEGSSEDYSLWLRAALARHSMTRSSRYMALRKIPIMLNSREARFRDQAQQIENERTELLRKNSVELGLEINETKNPSITKWPQKLVDRINKIMS